jgi:hypothetical protein
MFWESLDRSQREDIDERPPAPECLHGVLTTDHTPAPLPEIDLMRRRQREKANVRSPFGARVGDAR